MIRRNIHEERKVAENLLFRFSNENPPPRAENVIAGDISHRSREEQPLNIFQNPIRDDIIDEQLSCGTIISDIPFEDE